MKPAFRHSDTIFATRLESVNEVKNLSPPTSLLNSRKIVATIVAIDAKVFAATNIAQSAR